MSGDTLAQTGAERDDDFRLSPNGVDGGPAGVSVLRDPVL
jgi:hypothetical protein